MDKYKTEILEIGNELVCNIISRLSEQVTSLEVIPIAYIALKKMISTKKITPSR